MMTPGHMPQEHKEPRLSWVVWREDVNAGVIERFNVFDHSGFLKECHDAAVQYPDNRHAFEEAITRGLRYYYWCKCEWEVIVSGWPPTRDGREAIKVDVFTQISMNYERFMDYLWDHRGELKLIHA